MQGLLELFLSFGWNEAECTGKEDQDPDFSTGYIDFGARQYSPTLRRWMTPDPLSEKYYGISPYAFCNNNPVRYVDVDGMDWWDKAAGYGIGFFTNLFPGAGSLRDRYSPNDPSDYNIALRDVDLTMLVVGEALTKTGGTITVGGGVLAVAGVTATVTTAGTAVIVAGPVAVAGAEIAAAGTAIAATGAMMMANSTANQAGGYNRGGDKKNQSSEITFRQGTGDKARMVTARIPEGYKRVKGRHPHGKPVFSNGKNYITPDADGHNGGIWKMAQKEQELFNRETRMGTYDANLKRIGD